MLVHDYRTSATMENQFLGSDAAAQSIFAPLALAAGDRLWKGGAQTIEFRRCGLLASARRYWGCTDAASQMQCRTVGGWSRRDAWR